MTERSLMYSDSCYRVVIKDYNDRELGKPLQNEISIVCKEYATFCKVVEAVQGVLNDD